METMELIWLGALILFLLAEGMTATVTTVWFALGSLGALIGALCGLEFRLQISLFLLISLIALSALRPLVKKYINPRKIKTNTDSLIGTTGLVLEEICNIENRGRVKLGGMEWSARSSDDSLIPQGTVITVERIEGVRAFVAPVKEKV